MKLVVLVQKGIKFSEEIEYGVIYNDNGQYAVLKNHSPLTTTIKEGYLKAKTKDYENFIFVSQAIVVFKDNTLSCYALSAEIGNTMEEAKNNYLKTMYDQKNLSKKENIDYSKLEKELRENIMSAGAGHL